MWQLAALPLFPLPSNAAFLCTDSPPRSITPHVCVPTREYSPSNRLGVTRAPGWRPPVLAQTRQVGGLGFANRQRLQHDHLAACLIELAWLFILSCCLSAADAFSLLACVPFMCCRCAVISCVGHAAEQSRLRKRGDVFSRSCALYSCCYVLCGELSGERVCCVCSRGASRLSLSVCTTRSAHICTAQVDTALFASVSSVQRVG